MARQDPLIVRPVTPAEYEVTGELVVEAFRTLGDQVGGLYEGSLRNVAARVSSGDVLVAEMAGRIVGTVTYVDPGAELSEGNDADAGTIRMLGVSVDARGHGVGEALVIACMDRAAASGRRRVRLSTRPSMKSAQHIYERLGFRRDPKYDRSPAPGVNLMAYVLDLER